jgi:hypothetical protein
MYEEGEEDDNVVPDTKGYGTQLYQLLSQVKPTGDFSVGGTLKVQKLIYKS